MPCGSEVIIKSRRSDDCDDDVSAHFIVPIYDAEPISTAFEGNPVAVGGARQTQAFSFAREKWCNPWAVAFSASSGPAKAPLPPRDVAAMVMHLLNTRVVVDAVDWTSTGASNGAFYRPNWWRAVKFSQTAVRKHQLQYVGAAMPRLRRLECVTLLRDLSELAAVCASLRFLTDVRLGPVQNVSSSDLALLASGLTSLHIASCEALTDNHVSALYSCERLRHVSLQNSGLTSDGLAVLPQLPALESLDLSRSRQVTSLRGLTCLARPQSSALVELDVSATAITRLALRRLPRLRTLRADRCAILTVVGDLSHLESLTNLSMEGCELLVNVSAVSQCRLQFLSLSRGCSVESVDTVTTMSSLTELRVDGLRCVTVETLKALSELPALESLQVQNCPNLVTLYPMRFLRHLHASFQGTVAQLRNCYPALESYTVVDPR